MSARIQKGSKPVVIVLTERVPNVKRRSRDIEIVAIGELSMSSPTSERARRMRC
jgi:hypothetical protein